MCIEQKSERGIISYHLFPLHLPLMYLLLKKLNKEKQFYLQNLKWET